MYKLRMTRRAEKDQENIERANFKRKVAKMMGKVECDPYDPTPPGDCFEKLRGYSRDTYSRRLDIHNRFIYEVLPNTEGIIEPKSGKPYLGIVKIVSMWGHDSPPE